MKFKSLNISNLEIEQIKFLDSFSESMASYLDRISRKFINGKVIDLQYIRQFQEISSVVGGRYNALSMLLSKNIEKELTESITLNSLLFMKLFLGESPETVVVDLITYYLRRTISKDLVFFNIHVANISKEDNRINVYLLIEPATGDENLKYDIKEAKKVVELINFLFSSKSEKNLINIKVSTICSKYWIKDYDKLSFSNRNSFFESGEFFNKKENYDNLILLRMRNIHKSFDEIPNDPISIKYLKEYNNKYLQEKEDSLELEKPSNENIEIERDLYIKEITKDLVDFSKKVLKIENPNVDFSSLSWILNQKYGEDSLDIDFLVNNLIYKIPDSFNDLLDDILSFAEIKETHKRSSDIKDNTQDDNIKNTKKNKKSRTKNIKLGIMFAKYLQVGEEFPLFLDYLPKDISISVQKIQDYIVDFSKISRTRILDTKEMSKMLRSLKKTLKYKTYKTEKKEEIISISLKYDKYEIFLDIDKKSGNFTSKRMKCLVEERVIEGEI